MIIVRAIGIIVAVLVVVVLARPVISEYRADSPQLRESNIAAASLITNEDARYHYLLGLLSYSLSGEPNILKSIGHYRQSLERNPMDARTWLALARAYRDMGRKDLAEFAIGKAHSVNRTDRDLVWEEAVLSLLIENNARAVSAFKSYLAIAPEEQDNVYALLFTMGVEPGYILNNLIPASYPFYSRYMAFLENNKYLKETYDVWEKLKPLSPRKKDYLAYTDFLLSSKEVSRAVAIWNEFADRFNIKKPEEQSSNLLWNGSFELPIENGGLDWRLGKAEGVAIFIDKDIKLDGYASLSAAFDGKHNPDVYIARQIVPVEGGKEYTFTGFVKTSNITTKNGIFIEAIQHNCESFNSRSEMANGTNLWKKLETTFRTPSSCDTIVVAIRREQSQKFDNRIEGDVWIDGLTLTPAQK